MSKGSLIVRLIDIVLLLLFGFLAISQIEKKSPAKLPQSITTMKTQPDKEEILILAIYRDKVRKKLNYYVEGENLHLPSLKSVEDKIRSRKESLQKFNRELKVRIRSNWDLPIKYTMKIVKYCQSNNIKVGLDIQTLMK